MDQLRWNVLTHHCAKSALSLTHIFYFVTGIQFCVLLQDLHIELSGLKDVFIEIPHTVTSILNVNFIGDSMEGHYVQGEEGQKEVSDVQRFRQEERKTVLGM